MTGRCNIMNGLDNFAALKEAVSAGRLPGELPAVVKSTGPSENARELIDMREPAFMTHAERVWANGWTPLAQNCNAKRRPALIDGRQFKWSTFQERRPTYEEIKHHIAEAGDANLAIILGKTSSGWRNGINIHSWAWDDDVDEPVTSWRLRTIADEVFRNRRAATPHERPALHAPLRLRPPPTRSVSKRSSSPAVGPLKS